VFLNVCVLFCLVVIINGEIVPDSDPRAKAARGQSASPGGGSSAPRQRSFGARVAQVGQPAESSSSSSSGDAGSSSSGLQGARQGWGQSGRPRGGQQSGNTAAAASPAGPGTGGPLDQVAVFLGIQVFFKVFCMHFREYY